MTRQTMTTATGQAASSEPAPQNARHNPDTPHVPLPGTITNWFPLLPRARPPAQTLHQRIHELRDLAQPASGETRLSAAAEVLNKAALIASDCGLPDLARQLCWRQFDLFHAATPLTAQTAKLALQPIVNLGRLAIRDGDPTRAYRIFENVYQAVTTKSATQFDGRDIDFQHFIHIDQYQEPRRFLWIILLADGTRALTTAGRWDDALRHLEHYKGIGTRLLDGRQIAILARCVTGDVETALDMLDTSTTPEPWEQAVAACLRTLCLRITHQQAAAPAAAMLRAYHQLEPTPEHQIFRTRLGLCVIDLAADTPGTSQVIAGTVREAVAGADAHAARDVLSHQPCRASMTDTAKAALIHIVGSAGLRRGNMPPHLLHDLMTAAALSETQLAQTLRSAGCRVR